MTPMLFKGPSGEGGRVGARAWTDHSRVTVATGSTTGTTWYPVDLSYSDALRFAGSLAALTIRAALRGRLGT